MTSPTNLCACGTTAGYPHDPACPRPLFRAGEAELEAWDRAYQARRTLFLLAGVYARSRHLDSTAALVAAAEDLRASAADVLSTLAPGRDAR